jgi:hypothetical protein
MDSQEKNPIINKSSFWKRLFVGLLVISFSVFSLSLIIQTPFIQNWGLRQITNYLERKMETKVQVDEFDLNIFRHLELENIYIESPVEKGDTLLYSENLRVNFTSLLNILTGKFTINEISLNKGLLRFRRNQELGRSSITYLFEKLGMAADEGLNNDSGRKTNDPSRQSTLDFSLEHIDLDDVRLEYLDDLKSFNQSYLVGEAHIDLKSLDFDKKVVHAKALDLRNALIIMEKTGPPSDLKDIDTEIAEASTQDSSTINQEDWKILIDDFSILDCRYKMDNFYKSKVSKWPSEFIDYHHLDIQDIDIEADDFTMQGFAFSGQNAKLHILHENGFEISNFSSDYVAVNDTTLRLEGVLLQLNGTKLRDTIIFTYDQYEDYDSFVDNIHIQANSKSSTIAFRDLIRLVPSLSQNQFFIENRDKLLYLQGDILGTINRLRIRNMDLTMGDIHLKGDFRARDLAIKDHELLNLDLEESSFKIEELDKLLPNVSFPGDYKKLGVVHFSGNYDGYFQDFVANGIFATELGDAEMDMRLNFKEGRQTALYAGRLALFDFDIGKFTGSKDFGKVSLSGEIANGRGLTREYAYAELDGVISELTYKNYLYRNIELDGQLNEKLFDGSFSIEDENVDIDFTGVIDFRDSIPDYNFQAAIKELDFYAINLTPNPLSLSGNFDIDLRALDLDRLFGSAEGTNIRIVDSAANVYAIDSIHLNSSYDDIDLRSFDIYSDLISARVVGDYKVLQVVPLVKRHLIEHYPRFFSEVSIPDSVYAFNDQNLVFDIHLQDSKNWFGLAGIPDLRIENMRANGKINGLSDQFSLTGNVPEIHYKNFNIYRVDFGLEEKAGNASSSLDIVVLDVNEKLILEEISFDHDVSNDSILSHLNTSNFTQIFDRLNIKVKTIPDKDKYTFQLIPVDLNMFDVQWDIDPNNEITIWKDKIDIQHFHLTGGHEQFDVSAIGDRGLQATITGFDASYLDVIWDYEKLDFNGEYILDLSIGDVFDFKDYKTEIFSPELFINGDSFGQMEFSAKMPALGQKTDLYVKIWNGKHTILGEGYFYPPIKEVDLVRQNEWKLDVDLDSFPMRFWQYIIGDNISNTQGYLMGDVSFGGYINKTTLNGSGRVYDAQTTINYLGTTYFLNDQPFAVNDQMIDMTGAILTDEAGNRATVTGGLTHRHIKDLGLDAVISSPKFIGLKTTPQDNPLYYGYAVGRMYVTFSGRMDKPTISLDAETGEGTYLAIPIDYGTQAAEFDFVEFSDFKKDEILPIRNRDVSIEGLNFNMNVTVNEGAVVEIIFDEQSGEILRGTGNGDIQFSLSRTGEMNMTGVYEIEQGNYLFTNFIVRKPFIIRKGGTIQWDGDPFEARINVEAEYERLRASTAIFIEEYLLNATPAAKNDAGVRTEVDLKLLLTGLLSQPNIDFDFEFPNLSGEVKGYVDSKMRILKSDQNAMLEQVMGLLLTKSFLPSNTIVSSAGQVATSGIFNTVSELISAQLSSYLSGFLSDAVEGVGFISSIDFDIGFDFNPLGQNTDYSLDPNEILSESGNEVDFRLTNRLFNDRITLDLGGNYTTSSPLLESGKYFAGDYALEYELTDNRRLKIRFYHRNDVTIEGRKNKLGLGLSWRREFDSFGELFQSQKKEKVIQ